MLVNTWHTGRVHLQGYGAGDLAKLLSGMAPSFSRAQARSVSPQSDGDSSGKGNNLSSLSRGLYLMFLWWVHLIAVGSASLFQAGVRFFGNLRGRVSFGHTQRKKVRGAGSQAGLRRGARSRKAALALKARERGCVRNAIVSTIRSLTRVRIPLASWMLDRSRSSLVAHLSILLILSHLICGLRGHGKLHVVTESVPLLMNLTVPGSCLPINQDGATFQNAPYEGAIPICQFVAHLSCGDNFISARHLAFVSSLFFALVLVALVCLLGLPAFPVPGALGVSRCLTHARVLPLPVVPVPGALGVFSCPTPVRVLPSSCHFLPSCDFTHFRRSISVRRIGAVAVLLVLLGASTPILMANWSCWSTSGRSVPSRTCTPHTRRSTQRLKCSGDSHPGPRVGSRSSCCSFRRSGSRLFIRPGPLPVSPSRPTRFCTPPLPRDSSRHLLGSPAPRRRRSRSPVRPSSAHPQDQPVGPSQSRVFCPVASCPDHARPSHGWLSFQSMRPHIEAHLSSQLLGDIFLRVASEPRFRHV